MFITKNTWRTNRFSYEWKMQLLRYISNLEGSRFSVLSVRTVLFLSGQLRYSFFYLDPTKLLPIFSSCFQPETEKPQHHHKHPGPADLSLFPYFSKYSSVWSHSSTTEYKQHFMQVISQCLVKRNIYEWINK